MASEMPKFGDKIQTPLSNLIVAKEYLETSKSDVQWRDRFWQVVQDTFSINASCEIGEDVGSDPSLVRGTGLGRQFVPKASRGNILNRPTRGSRPLWDYRHIKPGRGPFGFVTPLIFSKRSILGLAKLLLSNKNYSIVKQVVVLYSYFRYVKFVSLG
jgi:hypothetical protein